MKRMLALILALSLLLVGCAFGRPGDEPEEDPPPVPFVPEPTEPDPPAVSDDEQFLSDLLAGMTLEEKVGQLFFVRCPVSGAAEDAKRFHLGGLLLFSRDYRDLLGIWLTEEQFTAKLGSYQSAAEIPLFIGSDEEGGSVTRATRNPNLFSVRASSPRACYESGGMDAVLAQTRELNNRLLTLGVNVNFAPVADVSTDPADFIYERSFGQDAAATADYIESVVREMGKTGIACVLKHFPGYGSNADTHTGSAVDSRPYSVFAESDFLPFTAGIDAGAQFVLVSHNVIECMDPLLPASLSPAVHRVLREECGFSGVIITDDLAMGALSAYVNDGSAAVLALLAGNDMLVTDDYETQIPLVLEAVRSGTLDAALIDGAVLRILRAKLELGLFDR